tara:strand:- start:7823 stop:8710 length:888 start_codon:yes stop_codon:yes gene_type:complete
VVILKNKYAYLASCIALCSSSIMAQGHVSSQESPHHFDLGAEGTIFSKKKEDNQINKFHEWKAEADYTYNLNSKIDLSAHVEYSENKISTNLNPDVNKARFVSSEISMSYNFLPTWSNDTVAKLEYAYASGVSMKDSKTYKIEDKLSKTFVSDIGDVTFGFQGNYEKAFFDESKWSWLASIKWSFDKVCFEIEGDDNDINAKVAYEMLDDLTLTAKYDQTSVSYLYSETEEVSMGHDLIGFEAEWNASESVSVMVGADYLYNGVTSLTAQDAAADASETALAKRIAFNAGFTVHF